MDKQQPAEGVPYEEARKLARNALDLQAKERELADSRGMAHRRRIPPRYGSTRHWRRCSEVLPKTTFETTEHRSGTSTMFPSIMELDDKFKLDGSDRGSGRCGSLIVKRTYASLLNGKN